MKNLFIMLLMSVAGLGSCASAASVTLRPGQSGSIGERRLTLVHVQDSRCQPKVKCVSAGHLRTGVFVNEGHTLRYLRLQWPSAAMTDRFGVGIQTATPRLARLVPIRVTFSDTLTPAK